LGTIIGSRLGHCLFYEPGYYLSNPLEILKVWNGGLASHGGAIALVLCIFYYAHKYGKANGFGPMWVFDRLGITVAFAGASIRLGNLFNSEIFGGATTLPWGFKYIQSYTWQEMYGPASFPPDGIGCHPTQLYEALSYIILGVILLWIYWHKSDKIYRGWLFGVFLIWLFGSRFLIEFVKNDQVAFESDMALNMGQWLSIPFIVAGTLIVALSYKYKIPALLERREGSTIKTTREYKENISKNERVSRAKRKSASS